MRHYPRAYGLQNTETEKWLQRKKDGSFLARDIPRFATLYRDEPVSRVLLAVCQTIKPDAPLVSVRVNLYSEKARYPWFQGWTVRRWSQTQHNLHEWWQEALIAGEPALWGHNNPISTHDFCDSYGALDPAPNNRALAPAMGKFLRDYLPYTVLPEVREHIRNNRYVWHLPTLDKCRAAYLDRSHHRTGGIIYPLKI